MKKRKTILILLLFFSAGGLIRMTPFQSCILASDSGRSQEISEEQRKREIKSMLEELKRQDELREERRRQRKREEFRMNIAKRWPEKAQQREPLWIQTDQRQKEFKNEME